MKNLIKKTLGIGALAGSLVFSGCGNKENNKTKKEDYLAQLDSFVKPYRGQEPFGQTIDSLKIYTQKNLQVYKDFFEFVKKNNNSADKEGYGIIYYSKKIGDEEILAGYYTSGKMENIRLEIQEGEKIFRYYDSSSDGLGEWDGYQEVHNSKKSQLAFLSPEEQLSIAKNYTNTLNEIMHEAKFKNY